MASASRCTPVRLPGRFHGSRHAGARLEPGQGQLLDLVLGQQLVQSGVAERVALPFRKVERAVGVEPGVPAPVLPAIAACRRGAFIMMSRGWNSLPILMIGCSLRRAWSMAALAAVITGVT
jgi:hypothetical protein